MQSTTAESMAKPQTQPSQKRAPRADCGGTPYSASGRFSMRAATQVPSMTKKAPINFRGSSPVKVRTAVLGSSFLWSSNAKIAGTTKETATQVRIVLVLGRRGPEAGAAAGDEIGFENSAPLVRGASLGCACAHH